MRLIRQLTILACSLCLLGLAKGVHAGDRLPVILEIMFPQVEVQRAGTEQWFAFSRGSLMAVGPGDRIRTGLNGRAALRFSQTVEAGRSMPEDAGFVDLVMLPYTTVLLGDYTVGIPSQTEGQRYNIDLTLENGRIVQKVVAPERVGAFTITLADTGATLAAGLQSAVMLLPNEPLRVIVADGEAVYQPVEGDAVNIAAGEGARLSVDEPQLVPLETGDASFVDLDTMFETCQGTVVTSDGRDLVVRTAPGDGGTAMGPLPNGSTVDLFGVNSYNNWYQVRIWSDRGWVRMVNVRTECTDLPDVGQAETQFTGAILPEPFELAVLEPFFGPVDENRWFYVRR